MYSNQRCQDPRSYVSGGLFFLPDGLLCSFDLDWNLYFHIAMMVNTYSTKFRGCSRNGDIPHWLVIVTSKGDAQ
jgi:hypothetical protein